MVEGVQRRKELRRKKRLDLLAQVWRLLALVAAAAGLGWLVLRNGWILEGPAQVQVSGAPDLSRDQVIQASGLHFPQPLLQLDPARVKSRLAAALPVEQVKVQRQMLPPRLTIRLREREAVARAQRQGPSGPEQGFVDRTGRWISPRQQAVSGASRLPGLTVVGWQERYQPSLELLLNGLPEAAEVRQLRLEANGEIWLVSGRLGNVRFGPLDDRLGRRVQMLKHLSSQLPKNSGATGARALDLSDPEHPELVMGTSRK